jgi:hypothetical protein
MPVTARFVGLFVIGLAIVMFVMTFVVAAAGWSMDIVVVLAVLGLVGVFALGWWLRSRAYVLRCTREGYRVRLVRSAGVREARWTQVEDAVAVTRHGVPCVRLRLKDGGTTTVPASLLDVEKEQFVRELQDHLQRGNGLKPPPRRHKA